MCLNFSDIFIFHCLLLLFVTLIVWVHFHMSSYPCKPLYHLTIFSFKGSEYNYYFYLLLLAINIWEHFRKGPIRTQGHFVMVMRFKLCVCLSVQSLWLDHQSKGNLERHCEEGTNLDRIKPYPVVAHIYSSANIQNK